LIDALVHPFEFSEVIANSDCNNAHSNLPPADPAIARLQPTQNQIRHPTPLESVPWGSETRENQEDNNPFLGYNAFQSLSKSDSLLADNQCKLDRLDKVVLGMSIDSSLNTYNQNLVSNSSNNGTLEPEFI
jgi:hypothetical protein